MGGILWLLIFAYKLLLFTLTTYVIQVIFCNLNGKARKAKKGLKRSKYLIDISISYK